MGSRRVTVLCVCAVCVCAQVRSLRYIGMFGYAEADLSGDDISLHYIPAHDIRQPQPGGTKP